MKRKFLLILLPVALICLPGVNLGQAPDLGTASTFAIFTSLGAIASAGTTSVTGDIGTNGGAYTGFPPGNVDGQTHIADGTSGQVAADVLLAYDALTPVPCDATIGIGLGNGQLLTTGVYCTTAASSLDGDLTLDGEGNPGALFIIKIDGALTTGILSNVNLTNGASFENVYWQINGAFTSGASSIFRGTVLINGAITLSTGAILQGRGLSIGGEINLDNNAVSNEAETLLSISSVNFSATREGNNALLTWSTASETNSKSFTIERSNSQTVTTWKRIGTLPAAGTSASTRQYKMVDNSLAKGANYYRLRSTDINGSYALSRVAIIQFDADYTRPGLFPNPVKNSLTVTGALQGSSIMLFDLAGKLLNKFPTSGNGSDHIQASQLAAGTYLLRIISADGNAVILKFRKQ